MIKTTFNQLISNYNSTPQTAITLWEEIASQHSATGRHYHTLDHLKNLLIQLSKFKAKINNWNVMLFSLYYHDIIYNILKSNNEEKSAAFAATRLSQIGVSQQDINACKEQIIATKKHEKSNNSDINYFIDADLSILGADWETYEIYTQNVRKEYSIYPNILYKRGRRKVLNHFLGMPQIFKTAEFGSLYETQAKDNLRKELASI